MLHIPDTAGAYGFFTTASEFLLPVSPVCVIQGRANEPRV